MIGGIDPGTVALVVAILAFLGTVVNPWIAARGKRAEKEQDAVLAAKAKQEDWDRQDLVAKRVEMAAAEIKERGELLIKSNAAKEAAAAERDAHLTEQLVEISAGNKQIHTLVNSNLTEKIQAELDARLRGLVSLKEIASLRKEMGKQPSEEAITLMVTEEHKISLLETQLAERARAQVVVDAEKAAAAEEAAAPLKVEIVASSTLPVDQVTAARPPAKPKTIGGAYKDAEKERRGGG